MDRPARGFSKALAGESWWVLDGDLDRELVGWLGGRQQEFGRIRVSSWRERLQETRVPPEGMLDESVT